MSRQIDITITTGVDGLIDDVFQELTNEELLDVVKDIDNKVCDYDFTEELLRHALEVMLGEATVTENGTLELIESTDPALKAALAAYAENRKDAELEAEATRIMEEQDEEIDFDEEFGSLNNPLNLGNFRDDE